MLTFEQALADQSDLEQLCADRPLKSREAFTPNALYGIDLILKRYAGLPPAYALKVIVPHGPYLDEHYLWEAERYAAIPVVLCYPPYRQRIYAEETDKLVVLSAAPFAYLVELLKDQPRPAERKGTIFFPLHSTHHLTIEMDYKALADQLTRLPAEYQPVTVCLYWKDMLLGRHLFFTQRGLRVVSAGHVYDPGFLFRFYYLCSQHHYAASNAFGSHLFYSIKAGCSFFKIDSVKASIGGDGVVLARDLEQNSAAIEATLENLFKTPRPGVTAEQLQTVDYYLGIDYLRPAQELKELLLWAGRVDWLGFVRWNKGAQPRLTIPTRYQRFWGHCRETLKLRTRLYALRNGVK